MTDLNAMFGLGGNQSSAAPQADYSKVGKTGHDMTAHREWATRPADERYISLEQLDTMLQDRRRRSLEIQVKVGAIEPTEHDGRLAFHIPGYSGGPVEPTNLGFGQLCSKIRAPADYLRRLPNDLAAKCMGFGFDASALADEEAIALITETDNGPRLRATTSVDYGRIWDSDLSGAVRQMAEKDNRWQVPIAFLKPGQVYNPVVAMDVTKEATTLYAGDRDCFLFLVDQSRPIVAGKLPDGSDRLFFRGVMTWNSEVRTRKFGLKTFLYQLVCQNRQIHGQAGVEEVAMRHSKNAPEKFLREIMPALELYMNGTAVGVEAGLLKAQQTIIARTPEQRSTFLESLLGLGAHLSRQVQASILAEEGHELATVFDAAQGLTAVARGIPNQDQRVELEEVAAGVMRPYLADA